MNSAPRLIEPTAQYFLYNTLQSCHQHRTRIYTYVLNIGITILFLGIGGLVLYYCNQQKISDEEKYHKTLKDQQYIMSKIRYYQDELAASKTKLSSITNLPLPTQSDILM
jgi:hypothetical protein